MRLSARFVRRIGIGLLIISATFIAVVAIVRVNATRSTDRVANPATTTVRVAPILPEEVTYSNAPTATTFSRRIDDLSLLEDDGAILVSLTTKSKASNGQKLPPGLIGILRSTESRFTGIGLAGSANVNGKPFSWANVNLSNISYG